MAVVYAATDLSMIRMLPIAAASFVWEYEDGTSDEINFGEYGIEDSSTWNLEEIKQRDRYGERTVGYRWSITIVCPMTDRETMQPMFDLMRKGGPTWGYLELSPMEGQGAAADLMIGIVPPDPFPKVYRWSCKIRDAQAEMRPQLTFEFLCRASAELMTKKFFLQISGWPEYGP